MENLSQRQIEALIEDATRLLDLIKSGANAASVTACLADLNECEKEFEEVQKLWTDAEIEELREID